MRRFHTLLTAILTLSFLSSCSPITGQLTILPSVPIDSDWKTRDIKTSGGTKTLKMVSLSRRSNTILELYIERFSADENSGTYDFTDRYYLELALLEKDDGAVCTVIGIKDQYHHGYLRSDDAGFSSLVEAFGSSSFDISSGPDQEILEISLPSGESLPLFHELAYEGSAPEELEHEGKLRQGTYREYVYYLPMGESFRLFFQWNFTYRNETGSSVSVMNSFDAYGTRTKETSNEGYSCVIESFSNRAYPRTFYNETDHEILFNRRIDALGFTQFHESVPEDGMRVITASANGTEFSWELRRTPLDQS